MLFVSGDLGVRLWGCFRGSGGRVGGLPGGERSQ